MIPRRLATRGYRSGIVAELVCARCRRAFLADTRGRARYCSHSCRQLAYIERKAAGVGAPAPATSNHTDPPARGTF